MRGLVKTEIERTERLAADNGYKQSGEKVV